MLCAIVALARELSGILHGMWVSETDFYIGFGAKITQRLRLKPAYQLQLGHEELGAGLAFGMLKSSKD
jgi:hypothetical protein